MDSRIILVYSRDLFSFVVHHSLGHCEIPWCDSLLRLIRFDALESVDSFISFKSWEALLQLLCTEMIDLALVRAVKANIIGASQ
jgi:hypothetical protein